MASGDDADSPGPADAGATVDTGQLSGGLAARLEDALLALLLLALIGLPVAEMVLRAAGTTGIVGIGGLVQHLTLVIGMLGAAIAAREQRLLALSVAPRGKLAGGPRRWLRAPVQGCSALVSALLALAAIDYIGFARESPVMLVDDLPAWWVQCSVPAGFALITLRLLWGAGSGAAGRAAALLVAVLGAALLYVWQPEAALARGLGLAALALMLALGAPIFVAIGGAALLLAASEGLPLAAVALSHIELTTNPSLPAIPLFTAAGYLLAEGGAPRRLVRVFRALLGRSRLGAAAVAVIASTFFTCFTGASGVAILALGGLLLPLLAAAGLGGSRGLALVTGAGSPGVLLAPSLPIILYGAVAQVRIDELFLAGVLPAAVLLLICLLWGARRAEAVPPEPYTFDAAELRAALWAAKWELALPLLVVTVLLGGLATPVETAAVTAAAALVLETAVHRDLHLLRDVPAVLARCGLLVGGVLLVLGVAMGLTNFLIDAQIPDLALHHVTRLIDSPWAFLLALNALLLAVGFLMDIFSAIVVLVPLLVPLGAAFEIAPLHLAMVFLANLQLGYLTPPVGMNLFFAAYRFERPVAEVYRAVWPLFLALCIGVLVITYVPWLSTALPALIG